MTNCTTTIPNSATCPRNKTFLLILVYQGPRCCGCKKRGRRLSFSNRSSDSDTMAYLTRPASPPSSPPPPCRTPACAWGGSMLTPVMATESLSHVLAERARSGVVFAGDRRAICRTRKVNCSVRRTRVGSRFSNGENCFWKRLGGAADATRTSPHVSIGSA